MCRRLFYFIDFYKFKFHLMFKKKNKYNSKLGSLASLISIISYIIIIIFNLKNLFLRKNFYMISLSHYNIDTKIYFNDTLMIFSFINSNGENLLNNTKLINFSILYNNGKENINIEYSTSICEKYIKNYKTRNFSEEFQCGYLNNIILKGRSHEEDYNYLLFSINICNENNCYDKEEIKSKLSNSYFYLFFPEYETNHYNYSNPVNLLYNQKIFHFSYDFNKIYEYFFSDMFYFSDDGIFFENFQETDYFMIVKESLDIIRKDNVNNYGQIVLNSNQQQISYYRNYDKFQDLIPSLTSMIQIHFYFCTFITQYFTKKLFNVEMVNSIMFKQDKNINKISIYKEKTIKINNNNSLIRLKDNIKSEISRKDYRNIIEKSQIDLRNFTEIQKFKQSPEYSFKNVSNFYFYTFKFKWYYYFIPNFIQLKNKNFIILNRCKEKIYENLSIETIFNEIENHKKKFLLTLYSEIT